MKFNYRAILKNSLTMIMGLCLFSETSLTTALAAQGGLDVYIVYAGKDKKDKTALKKVLSGDLKVKFYNVDLLALADYSGKQKAIAKLGKAKVVLVIKDVPHELLEGASLKADVVIFNSAKSGIQSEDRTLYVVGKGISLGEDVKTTHQAATEADLSNSGALKAADAVVIDGAMDIHEAVALNVATML